MCRRIPTSSFVFPFLRATLIIRANERVEDVQRSDKNERLPHIVASVTHPPTLRTIRARQE